jgi:hypothetical protein
MGKEAGRTLDVMDIRIVSFIQKGKIQLSSDP